MKNNLNLSQTFSPCLKSITSLCLASTFIFMTFQAQASEKGGKLSIPKSGKIRVAFAVTQHANVIDLTSAWEVFQDVTIEKDGKTYSPFELFVVSDNLEPVTMTGGLQLLPQYTFENAPQPHVISVGAQRGGDGLIQWLKKTAPKTDLTMSICTGAFQLAAAGLLDGLKATTHHDFFDSLEKKYPKIKLQRGFRFVEGAENIATAGGLTSGFDMALRVVERYFGKKVADKTAYYMEFQRGTKNNIDSGASQQADRDDTKIRGGAKEGFTIVEIKKKDVRLVGEILKHREKAIGLNQKIFVQIVAVWCVPCKTLRANMGHRLMGDAFQGTYIVQLDFDEWFNQLPDINVPNKKLPIPAFFRIDAKGVATNQTINGGAWEDDTPENMAPVLKKYFLN